MRRASLIGVCAAAALAGCGDDGSDQPPALQRVDLRVTAPADGAVVRGGTVDVRGSVSPPSAEVTVLGRPALVAGGDFTVVVPLREGMNIVDVAAGARDRRPAFSALRVTRDVRVTVPDLVGFAEDDAAARVQALGLLADVTRTGGILEALRSGDRVVCEQVPGGGTRVRRDSAVRLLVAKRC